jgi:hypothetical protein
MPRRGETANPVRGRGPERRERPTKVTAAPSVLVATCLTWSSTAALPRLFAEAGLHVTAMSPGPLALCTHVTTHMPISRNPQRAARDVLALLATRTFDWVVVADEVLLHALVASGGDSDQAPWAPFDLTDPTVGRFLLSKHAFVEQASRFGIAIPPSRLVTSVEEGLAFAGEFDYPLLVRGDRGFAGMEVTIASDPAELCRATSDSIQRYGRAALQRFIRGSSISVSVLYAGGVPLAIKAYRTDCGFPTPISASTRHGHFAHPAIEPVVHRIGALTGFDGMAGIDFMHDPATNELLAIEVNPRPTLGFGGARVNREFFTPAIHRFLSGEAQPLITYDGREPVQTYFPGHLFFALAHPRKTDVRAVAAALSEFRPSDWRTALWEVGRFARDRLVDVARGFGPAEDRGPSSAREAPSHEADGDLPDSIELSVVPR